MSDLPRPMMSSTKYFVPAGKTIAQSRLIATSGMLAAKAPYRGEQTVKSFRANGTWRGCDISL
jgi:hypothetical protein